MNPPIMMEWISGAIIPGLRMGVSEGNLVISMAKEAEIQKICKDYIDSKINGMRFTVP